MSKNSQDQAKANPLVDFMKKQINQKAQDQARVKNTKNPNFKSKLAKKSSKNGKNDQNDEDLTDEEKLEKAKKESKGKAMAVQDKAAMYQRLFIETLMRYSLLIVLLLAALIAFINMLPALGGGLKAILANLFLGDIN